MSELCEELMIILRIEEGIGFDKNSTHSVVVASLGGNQIESDIVPTGNTTLFNNNLIFETDKQSVKRMKRENLPVKLDCYSINLKTTHLSRSVPNQIHKKTLMGNIILPFRCITFQTHDKAFSMVPHWHNLTGLNPEWKSAKPQLLLFLAITRKNIQMIPSVTHNSYDDPKSAINKNVIPDFTVTKNIDHIQIGIIETDDVQLTLIINLERSLNLDNLNDHEDLLNQHFMASYNYFGFTDEMLMVKNFDGSYLFEKPLIALNFRISKSNINKFFGQQFKFKINFFHHQTLVGIALIIFKNQIKIDEFLQKTKKDVIGFKCWEQYTIENIRLSANSRSIVFASLHIKKMFEDEIVADKIKEISEKNSKETILLLRHTFSLILRIISVQFVSRPGTGIWQISLHHPKADNSFTAVNIDISDIPNNLTIFNDIELKLNFTDYVNEIMNVIRSESCTLIISGPFGIEAKAILDSFHLINNTNSEQHGIVLMGQYDEVIATTNLYVIVNDLGINLNCPESKKNFVKSNFNGKLASDVNNKLEEWKVKEQGHFLIKLKEKEKKLFEKISKEWHIKQIDRENLLAKNMDECQQLAIALQEVQKKLFFQDHLIKNASTEKCINENENLKISAEKYENHLRASSSKSIELEIQVNTLCNENDCLKSKINELEYELREIRNSHVPKCHLNSMFNELKILQDRLEEKQRSKNAYKEKWAKLLREFNRMAKEQDVTTKFVDRNKSLENISFIEISNDLDVDSSDEIKLFSD